LHQTAATPLRHEEIAPGAPGKPQKWMPSSKSGVGTALPGECRVWFTLLRGFVSEVFWPRVDRAAMRSLRLIVTDGRDYSCDELDGVDAQKSYLESGVPAYRVVNRCGQRRIQIEKEIICNPFRDALLIRVRFVPLVGSLEDYHLYAHLEPHLCDGGEDNSAYLGEFKGVPLLCGQKKDAVCALATTASWLRRSVGFVGASDGLSDLKEHGRLTSIYDRADHGSVALTGEIDLQRSGGEFLLALTFGSNEAEAGHHAIASFLDGFDACKRKYIDDWKRWQATVPPLSHRRKDNIDLFRVSTMVMRLHEAHQFPGGAIASLSVPWGEVRKKAESVGYHVVWPRDLSQRAGAMLAAGAHSAALDTLRYLWTTQEADGHWPQNMWLDGSACWTSLQMDEVALPILLADLARREGRLKPDDQPWLWNMIRRAAGFIVRCGPGTREDRWEQNSGYSPYTVATQVAALVIASEWASRGGCQDISQFLLETADAWNAQIEQWTYVSGTELCRRVGVDGYYIRIAPYDVDGNADPTGLAKIANRKPPFNRIPAADVVSPDGLALVRYGLRRPDDPRILNTIRVIDAALRTDTPGGPVWRRYTYDGYGETEAGEPFNGIGLGRGWPLLTGERAHYELASGHVEQAQRLRNAMEYFSNEGGFMPEQVWDAPDLPQKRLYFGRPSGSAMPLVWTHAEYVTLLRSLRDRRVFDTPPQVRARYALGNAPAHYEMWRPNLRICAIPAGRALRIATASPAEVRYRIDNGADQQQSTHDTQLGLHAVDISAAALSSGKVIRFTINAQRPFEGDDRDFLVRIKS
jgi:glucoamylase